MPDGSIPSQGTGAVANVHGPTGETVTTTFIPTRWAADPYGDGTYSRLLGSDREVAEDWCWTWSVCSTEDLFPYWSN